ncbi:Heterokaryon incompatibility protein 6 [Escovopsis weberi]|uniref:Heterokaryon incompatibility protein 6 n=1 Tax=Escovopsis weberi TaxID=150374 RepID=A0A0M8N286_ESCWE|nr:Heterokaryon incompatibility protein 6 [Escovopsis weberi]
MSLSSIFPLEPLKPFEYPDLVITPPVFRVIRLLPPKPSIIPGCHGTVRIELFTVDAAVDADSPMVSYDALSYVWNVPPGSPPPDSRIIIETDSGPRELRIYRSLELALLHLYATGNAERVIFADQICINQSCHAEKSYQVQLMKFIYSRCVRTIIWLGPGTRVSDRYFDYVSRINHEGVLGRVMGPRVADFMHVFDAVMDPALEVTPDQRQDRDDLLAMVRRFGPTFPIAGYADVLDRAWFSRLWTIQEACLAPSVVFLCGAKALCFDCFRAGSLFYSIYNTHWINNINGPRSRSELSARNAIFDKTSGFTRIFQERKAIHQLGVRQTLYSLVLKYNVNDDRRKIGSSLPQDRIFGLLGLVDDNDPLARRVRVSYDLPAQTYTEVTALLLEHSIDALLFSQFPKHTDGLPSWVPDWAMDLAVPVAYSELKTPVFAAGIGPHQPDAATPPPSARFAVDAASRELTISGVLIDTIAAVGVQSYQEDREPQIMSQVEYRAARRTFDEIAQFVQAARKITSDAENKTNNKNDGNHSTYDDDETAVDEAHAMCLRICDSGLTHRHFAESLGPGPGSLARLSTVHASISDLGARLIRSDETIEAYHISRILPFLPFLPGKSPTTTPLTPSHILRALSSAIRSIYTRPLASALALWSAASDLRTLCAASARITLMTHWARFRRRFLRVDLTPSREHLISVGVDPDVAYGQDMNAFTTALLRNRGRRVFRTRGGLVGMGPARMRDGDKVVVFRGGTAAHILRPVEVDAAAAAAEENAESRGDSRFEYIGESYCDGMMDGQALDLAGHERDFILV